MTSHGRRERFLAWADKHAVAIAIPPVILALIGIPILVASAITHMAWFQDYVANKPALFGGDRPHQSYLPLVVGIGADFVVFGALIKAVAK